MSARFHMALLGLILLAMTTVFQLKYAVVGVEEEIVRVEEAITAERWSIRSLEADRAQLLRPQRMARQAARLDMVPASGERIIQAHQLGQLRRPKAADDAQAVTLPGGGEVELRFKPPLRFSLPRLHASPR